MASHFRTHLLLYLQKSPLNRDLNALLDGFTQGVYYLINDNCRLDSVASRSNQNPEILILLPLPRGGKGKGGGGEKRVEDTAVR